MIYRPLVVECFDPGFLRVAAGGRRSGSIGGPGAVAHLVFLVLVVVNLVAGMQALGTLMSVGLLLLPAAAARLWAGSVGGLMVTTSGIAMAASLLGLVLSYHLNTPSGPSDRAGGGLFLYRLPRLRAARRPGAALPASAPSRTLSAVQQVGALRPRRDAFPDG